MGTKKGFLDRKTSLTEKIWKSGSVCHLWRKRNAQIVGQLQIVPSELVPDRDEILH